MNTLRVGTILFLCLLTDLFMVGSYAMPLPNYCEYHSCTSWFLEWHRPTVDLGGKQQQQQKKPVSWNDLLDDWRLYYHH